MSESMYKEENNNISYIYHVGKQFKKCIDWRQLETMETPRWLEESPAAPVADTTVVIPRQHGWFHEWMIRGVTSRWYHSTIYFFIVNIIYIYIYIYMHKEEK